MVIIHNWPYFNKYVSITSFSAKHATGKKNLTNCHIKKNSNQSYKPPYNVCGLELILIYLCTFVLLNVISYSTFPMICTPAILCLSLAWNFTAICFKKCPFPDNVWSAFSHPWCLPSSLSSFISFSRWLPFFVSLFAPFSDVSLSLSLVCVGSLNFRSYVTLCYKAAVLRACTSKAVSNLYSFNVSHHLTAWNHQVKTPTLFFLFQTLSITNIHPFLISFSTKCP